MCFLYSPLWVNVYNDYQGLQKCAPDSLAIGVELFWGVAEPAIPTDQIFYNIYYSTNRFGTFSNGPQLMSIGSPAIVPIGLAGQINYFGVRATEFDPTIFDITQLQQVGYNLYQYPSKVMLDAYVDAYDTTINVSSTVGFPSQGYIQVEDEVILYNSVTATSFDLNNISGRGQFQTTPTFHLDDAYVMMFAGPEDGNSNIIRGVKDWDFNEPPYVPDSYGEPNADVDGYRAALVDNITADLSQSDLDNTNFDSIDQCGFYHITTPFETMTGLCAADGNGSYLGSTGFNFQDALNGRLAQLVNSVGEVMILLKRKWVGRRCRCIDLRREFARSRCPNCFGTSFEGGYDQYFNPNSISEQFNNTFGGIMVRVSPWNDTQKLEGNQALRQDTTLSCNTLPTPSIAQRDIMIRFNPIDPANPNTLVEEFRYDVTQVTRNRSLFGAEAAQQFNLYRLDKTDQIYTYPIEFNGILY